MKNWKKIAVLSVILVVFVTAFILMSNNQKKIDAEKASPSPSDSVNELKLVDMKRDDISKIILKHDDGEIVLTNEEREIEKLKAKDDGTSEKVKEKTRIWVNPDFDVDTAAVDDIALAAETATTSRLIEENPKDLSIYGLDKPAAATFVSNDGKEAGIEIGDKTPTGEGYYVKQTGKAAVYTLDSSKGDSFVLSKLDIMNKNLYGSEALAAGDVSVLSFTKDGKKIFDSKFDSSTAEWAITYPMERKADAQELDKFIQWAVGFRASGFVNEKAADLKPYGLDKPKYVFDYTLGGKTYSLKVGALNDSKYYGQMEGNSAVFTIDSSALTFVDVPLIDLIDTFAYIPSIYDVEKLVIEMDGRVDVLLIDASQTEGYEEKFYLNDKKIEGEDNMSLFKKYYQGAIGMSGDKIDLSAVPAGKAFAKLTYTLKKASPDKTVTVELVPTNDGYGYYILKNGKYTGMVMGSRKLDEEDFGIRWYYKNLMDALSKTP